MPTVYYYHTKTSKFDSVLLRRVKKFLKSRRVGYFDDEKGSLHVKNPKLENKYTYLIQDLLPEWIDEVETSLKRK